MRGAAARCWWKRAQRMWERHHWNALSYCQWKNCENRLTSDEAWATAHKGKWGQLTPLEKMDENYKAKTCKKSSFLCLRLFFGEQSEQAGVENGARLTTYWSQIYFRVHHFLVKFSKFSSPRAARGHWPPNQNPADVPDGKSLVSCFFDSRCSSVIAAETAVCGCLHCSYFTFFELSKNVNFYFFLKWRHKEKSLAKV